MHRAKHHLTSCLITLLTLAALPFPALAQDEDKGGDKRESVQIRVLCSQPVEGATELSLRREDAVLHQLSLTPSMVSDPLAIGRGDMVLTRRQTGEEIPAPLLTVRIPDIGRRFVLALFPASADAPKAPYQHLLIRTDGLRFGASDLYLFNFTRIPIGGSLGSSSFTLAPGKSQVVTPALPGGERMYQARFFHEHEGQARLFSDTRWPLAATARVYLFFIADPLRQTVSYISFREYAPFD
jgi:hypothetical protein